MKKVVSMLIVLSLLLCGCGAEPAPETTAAPTTEAPTTEVPTTAAPTTEAPTEAPTEPPTEAPTEPPVPTNPLTGEVLEAPLETRIFAVSINNVPGAMPVYGVSRADLFFEMFINGYATRGLALYADITEAKSVGSVRSLRYNFIDLCQTYDAIVVHASGSRSVMNALYKTDVPNISAESELADYYFRDYDRVNAGYSWEHCLFIKGPETLEYAESKGIRVTQEPDKDYGLTFAEDGTPAGGEKATYITINMIHDGVTKRTIMDYDENRGMYLYNQYTQDVFDVPEKQYVYFENVIVMLCPVTNQGSYHVADLVGSGEGWFACNGQIIPIKWSHESLEDPIVFTHTDGTPLDLGVGNSYIAIAPLSSQVLYE